MYYTGPMSEGVDCHKFKYNCFLDYIEFLVQNLMLIHMKNQDSFDFLSHPGLCALMAIPSIVYFNGIFAF